MNCESVIQGSRDACSQTDRDNVIRDFQRDVYCLFGLPVDNLSLIATKALVRNKAPLKQNLVLSTININWVVRSFADPAFRAGILNSDLVTLDGKPLVWLAKILGYPMRETVAGSTLIQELRDEKSDKPLTIFLFGGDVDAAKNAMARLNEREHGLRAVGAVNPGYGSVKKMSTTPIINTINNTSPDILLVALGAEKGVAWIERNRHRLNAGVISHLGATVNFLAGTIHRAPKFMQDYGLEWVWRILQEPKLFFRYAGDGLMLSKTLLRRSPLWLRYLSWSWRSNYDLDEDDNSGVWQEEIDGAITIILGRNPKVDKESALREMLCRAALANKDLTLDFHATERVNGGVLGLLLILQKHQLRQGRRLLFHHLQRHVAEFFLLCGLDPNLPGGEF